MEGLDEGGRGDEVEIVDVGRSLMRLMLDELDELEIEVEVGKVNKGVVGDMKEGKVERMGTLYERVSYTYLP